MKPYAWKEALVNGALAFLACFGAKFPAIAACVVSVSACENVTPPSFMDLRHAFVTCGTVLVAVEIRYIWRYLHQFENYPDDLTLIKK